VCLASDVPDVAACRLPCALDASTRFQQLPSPWFLTTSTAYASAGFGCFATQPDKVRRVSAQPDPNPRPRPPVPKLRLSWATVVATAVHPQQRYTPRRIPLAGSGTASLRPLPSCRFELLLLRLHIPKMWRREPPAPRGPKTVWSTGHPLSPSQSLNWTLRTWPRPDPSRAHRGTVVGRITRTRSPPHGGPRHARRRFPEPESKLPKQSVPDLRRCMESRLHHRAACPVTSRCTSRRSGLCAVDVLTAGTPLDAEASSEVGHLNCEQARRPARETLRIRSLGSAFTPPPSSLFRPLPLRGATVRIFWRSGFQGGSTSLASASSPAHLIAANSDRGPPSLPALTVSTEALCPSPPPQLALQLVEIPLSRPEPGAPPDTPRRTNPLRAEMDWTRPMQSPARAFCHIDSFGSNLPKRACCILGLASSSQPGAPRAVP
jgi:hypothetical protein